MKITSIRIRTLSNTGNKMVGLVSLTLGGMVAINDIKILKNQNELFLAMPSRPTNQRFSKTNGRTSRWVLSCGI